MDPTSSDKVTLRLEAISLSPFQTDAGLVTVNDNRTLDDKRFHGPLRLSPRWVPIRSNAGRQPLAPTNRRLLRTKGSFGCEYAGNVANRPRWPVHGPIRRRVAVVLEDEDSDLQLYFRMRRVSSASARAAASRSRSE